MGGVGYKLALELLGLPELVRQVVELPTQHRKLIVATHFDLVSIVALPNDAHGSHDPAQASCEGLGTEEGEYNHHQDQQPGDGQDIIL